MNDVKIDVKNRTISFGDFIKFYDVPEYVINYINQLKSNWNKIKNYCEKDGDDYVYNVYKYMIALEKNEDVSDYESD